MTKDGASDCQEPLSMIVDEPPATLFLDTEHLRIAY
jgi:hypothetical protein